MTGENFKRIERGADVKRLKEKIRKLEDQCVKLLNVNEVRENGFDEEKYNNISREIEWTEYLLWGQRNKKSLNH